MGSFPPDKTQHWLKVLKKLGFTEVQRIGKGKHAHKFIHPIRHTSDYRQQPDFIIIPHKMYKQLSVALVKELGFFGFSQPEIKRHC
jgi:hypothetical protein